MSSAAATPLKDDTVNLAGQAAAAAAQDPRVQEAAGEAALHAAGQVATNAIRTTGRVLGEASHSVVIYLKQNHYSVHALSFIGGLALTISSAYEVIVGFFSFAILSNILGYITSWYSLSFGIVICSIDGPTDKFPGLRAMILKYASFMQNNSTRFLFYLFVACMEHNITSYVAWIHTLVGYYFLFIAAMHLVLHFNDLRRSWSGGADSDSAEPAHINP
mmetsp:Transcript_67266/g.119799  ORF Transcript_67266/g.119799 Transcript_67266/m.119799 type:complete len:218 (-) Transcript_67266:31-684(-)